MELKGVRMGVLTCFDVEVILLSHSCLLCARTFSVVIADHGSALCMKGGGARSTLACAGARLLIVMGCNSDAFIVDTLVRVRAFENLAHLVYLNSLGLPAYRRRFSFLLY